MSRRHLTFPCEGETLVATLDEGESTSGLLIVSGGSETRAGAFCGMASLASRIAQRGHPVLRFDRRGVGDSSGENRGFMHSGHDMAVAIAYLLIENPQLKRIVGFGNCDAASALMMFSGAGCHSLVLANPWTFENDDEPEHSATELRARYLEKLKNPHEVLRLFTGKVSLGKLAGGLKQAARRAPRESSLIEAMEEGLDAFDGLVRILIADKDRTGLAFLESWPSDSDEIITCKGATHSFVEPHARDFLFEQLIEALEEE